MTSWKIRPYENKSSLIQTFDFKTHKHGGFQKLQSSWLSEILLIMISQNKSTSLEVTEPSHSATPISSVCGYIGPHIPLLCRACESLVGGESHGLHSCRAPFSCASLMTNQPAQCFMLHLWPCCKECAGFQTQLSTPHSSDTRMFLLTTQAVTVLFEHLWCFYWACLQTNAF